MKMPDPIIDPTTIIVPSNRPMARTNPCSDLVSWDGIAMLDSAILRPPQFFAAGFTAVRRSSYVLVDVRMRELRITRLNLGQRRFKPLNRQEA
jgi:hypothetical protein